MIGFRAGFFNIGGQGQFYVGACAALAISLGWREGPAPLVILAGTLAAVLAGALWSLLPGYLRVRFGTDEVLTTLMMSFIGALVLQYLTAGPMRKPVRNRSDRGKRTHPRDVPASPAARACRPPFCCSSRGVTVLVWLLLERTPFRGSP